MVSLTCDSSSLIALAETCNLGVLGFLSKEAGASFLIPPFVKDEIISRPLKAREHAFSALRLRKQLDDGFLRISSSPSIMRDTHEVLNAANTLFRVRGKHLKLLHDGEAQALALFKSAKVDALLVDEKTLRLLIESPKTLAVKIEGEYDETVEIDEKSANKLKKYTRGVFVMRSSELLAVAFKKGFFDSFGSGSQDVFQAAVFALRKAGCSLTNNELSAYNTVLD
ncbi:MAG: hypothetical protein V1811_02200 [Candidatus Micrarchaeota archaeon]